MNNKPTMTLTNQGAIFYEKFNFIKLQVFSQYIDKCYKSVYNKIYQLIAFLSWGIDKFYMLSANL